MGANSQGPKGDTRHQSLFTKFGGFAMPPEQTTALHQPQSAQPLKGKVSNFKVQPDGAMEDAEMDDDNDSDKFIH